MEQTHTSDDLHDLVTLDPTIRDYVNLPPSMAPSSSSNGAGEQSNHSSHSRRVSAHLFSSFSPSPIDDESNASQTSAAMNQRRSTRWPFLSMRSGSISRQSVTMQPSRPSTSDTMHYGADGQETRESASTAATGLPAVVLNAQKDSDDVDDTYEIRRRQSVARRNTATSMRVNRLFTMQSPCTSREPSFQKESKQKASFNYIRSQPGEPASLPHHLLDRGLMQGKHSDITIKVFDREYNLHRIILDRAPFFSSALSPPWCEASQREVELHPEDIDSNITQRAFELALKRLYGCSLRAEEDEEAVSLFATGCWLEMQDLINDSMAAIMKKLGPANLAPVIQVVSANYYGKPGDRILGSAKAMLCRNGADMAITAWDGVPIDLVAELVGSDGFFVNDEWSRWRLAKRLLDRRLKLVAREAGLWSSHSCQAPAEIRDRAVRPKPAIVEEAMARIAKHDVPAWRQWEALYGHDEIRPLLALLDEDIHYVHMDFEQLQSARAARDVLGVPVLVDTTIQNALWGNLELRQKVLNAAETEFTLGLQQHEPTDLAEKCLDARGSPLGASTSKKVLNRPSNTSAESSSPRRPSTSTADHRYKIPSVDGNMVLGGDDEPVYTTRAIDNSRDPHATSHLVTQADDAENTENLSYDLEKADSSATTIKPAPPTYSDYPPFRFAVELPSARMLKDRRKVFSHTVFYAGSHWNVYIKKVKSGAKNPHLGVYLHRAPQQQRLPTASPPDSRSVDRRIGVLEQRMQGRGGRTYHRPQYLAAHLADPNRGWAFDPSQYGATTAPQPPQTRDHDPSPPQQLRHAIYPDVRAGPYLTSQNTTSYSESSTSVSSDPDHPTADLESHTYQPTRPQVPTLAPYVDKRPTIKTYFKIYSPSRGGRMLSVYESIPCDFNFSQSWGWKSSTLMMDDEEEDEEEVIIPVDTSFVADGDPAGLEGKERDGPVEEGTRKKGVGGFRFIVCLGVV